MKNLKRLLWLFLTLAIILPTGFYYFLKKNDAPILQGKVDFCLNYKNDLQLDIYEPTQEVHEKRPVLVYIHGGAWIGGRKETVNNARFHGAFNALREKGYAIVSPNYTLAKLGKSPFPNCIIDAFDAISWIEQNAEIYNFDLENVGVMGESAGGHIAMMTAYADVEKFTKPHRIDLKYVVGVYPPSDLGLLYKEQHDMVHQVESAVMNMPDFVQKMTDINQYLFGFDPHEDESRTKEFTAFNSPVTYLKKGIPNTLIIHGDKDRIVPIEQSIQFKSRIEALGLPLDFHILEGVDHAFINATPEQKQQTQKWIIEFVERHYYSK